MIPFHNEDNNQLQIEKFLFAQMAMIKIKMPLKNILTKIL